MAQMVVRKIDDDVKHRLRERAARHGRSLEAEARAILTLAASQPMEASAAETAGFGTRMAKLFAEFELTEDELERPHVGEDSGMSRVDFSGPEWDNLDR